MKKALQYLWIATCLTDCGSTAAQGISMAGAAGYTKLGVYRLRPQQALEAGANQAALPQYTTITTTVYGEKRFLLDDLSYLQLGLVMPVQTGAFGLQAASFGSAAYSESRAGLAYGRSLGNKVGVGVQLNYERLHISGYGSQGTVSAELGMLFQLSEGVRAGVHVYNPTGSAMGRFKQKPLPQVFAAGLGYAPSHILYMSTTLVKEAGQPLSLQAGLQYRLLDQIQVAAGVSTATTHLYMGIGYEWPALALEAVTAWHPQLGISPGLMLTFNKKQN